MADSKSVSSGSNATSDALTLNDDSVAINIQLKADNSGTPASGDTVTFYVLETLGDPDGASTDEYSTYENCVPIVVDTNTSDPALAVVGIRTAVKAIKVYAVNNASSNAITVSATTMNLDDAGVQAEQQVEWT